MTSAPRFLPPGLGRRAWLALGLLAAACPAWAEQPLSPDERLEAIRHGLAGKLAAEGAVLPKIYCVNWFRKDENGKFVWPGFGENMRVLSWILGRAEGTAKGKETVFGICPEHADMHWNGLDYSVEKFEKAITVGVDDWKNELKLHSELFEHLGERLPKELIEARSKIEKRLNA